MALRFSERVKETFRAWVYPLLDTVVIGFSSPSRLPTSDILLIQTQNIGDFVIWLDAAAALRQAYREEKVRLVLIAAGVWGDLAEQSSLFDEVWRIDAGRFATEMGYRWQFLRRLRQRRFAKVIHPVMSRLWLVGDALVRGAVAAEKVGSTGDCANIKGWKKRISNRWYTRLVPASAEPLMELERNAEFVRGLGIPEFRAGLPVLPITAPAPAGLPQHEYYVLFPGASMEFKKWPAERFAELAQRIHDRTGWHGVVCGGPGEEGLAERIISSVAAPLVSLAGKTSLPELATVIARARILVGNDTGAVHIAAAVSTPSVCIYGAGHFGRFFPYRLEKGTDRPLPITVFNEEPCGNCNWRCRYPVSGNEPFPCIARITVDQVWAAMEKVLDGKMRHG